MIRPMDHAPDTLTLAGLDRQGFLPAHDEDEAAFRARAAATLAWSAELRERPLVVPGLEAPFQPGDRLGPADLEELGRAALERYGILCSWVPAYWTDAGLPRLAGGQAFQFGEGGLWRACFQLKARFRASRRWLIYDAGEIVAHEMCHAARFPLAGRLYEESFAYALSPSRLRRAAGSLLVDGRDGSLLLGSLGISLAWDLAQLAWLPPWWARHLGKLPILAVIALGIARSVRIRAALKRAAANLEALSPGRSQRILFRLDDDEIGALAALSPESAERWWAGMPGFRGAHLRGLFPQGGAAPAGPGRDGAIMGGP